MYPYYRTSPTAFVKDDYYCECGTTGLAVCANVYLCDPLWDGKICSAGSGIGYCIQMEMPKLYRKILDHVPSSENIEVRIFKNNHTVMKAC